MLTFIIIYLVIGLAIELIIDGKRTIKDIKNKKYSILSAILGTIFMSVIAPVSFAYVFITGIIHSFKKIES